MATIDDVAESMINYHARKTRKKIIEKKGLDPLFIDTGVESNSVFVITEPCMVIIKPLKEGTIIDVISMIDRVKFEAHPDLGEANLLLPSHILPVCIERCVAKIRAVSSTQVYLTTNVFLEK